MADKRRKATSPGDGGETPPRRLPYLCNPSSREEGIPMKLSFGLRLRCTVLSR